jgi:hypothetical protein
MTYPKFIVQGDKLILGKVQYHKQLKVGDDKINGGGLFALFPDANEIGLFGESFDFGAFSADDIKRILSTNPHFYEKRSGDTLKSILSGFTVTADGEVLGVIK